MSKKIILYIIVAVVSLGLLIFFFPNVQTYIKTHNGSATQLPVTNKMSGRITSVNGSVYTVEGAVNGKDTTVEITVTQNTSLVKSSVGITDEQIKSGKPFHPTTTLVAGSAAELVVGTHVNVTTKSDLSKTNKSEAVEINYVAYDLPR